MEALSITHQKETIQWKQLWSLAALYGSVVIGWIAYQNYQPKLLEEFHFSSFSFLLFVLQGVIMVIIPPIAGRLGDRYRLLVGNRIPVITTGMSLAAMVFMAVAFTLFSDPGEILKWVLPLLIVCWLIAMSIFTSPALSTLELFTPVDKLPRAMAVITIVANLLYSIEPVIVDVIDYLGAPVTFMAGGVAVFLSGYALRRNSLLLLIQKNTERRPVPAMTFDTQRSRFAYIVFLGIALGVPTTMMFNIFPDLLGDKFGALLFDISGKVAIVLMLVFSAFISWPMSHLVNKAGLRRSFWWSFVLIGFAIVAMILTQGLWLLISSTVLFTVAFTSLSVSSLPLALRSSNYYEKVFCVGLFFGGVALPNGIVEAMLAW